MRILKIKNPLTESFLIQLDVDLDGLGLDDLVMKKKGSVRLAPFATCHRRGLLD